MIDMIVQLMCMIGMLESKLCSECDTEQATNGDAVALGGNWCMRLTRLASVLFEHTAVI